MNASSVTKSSLDPFKMRPSISQKQLSASSLNRVTSCFSRSYSCILPQTSVLNSSEQSWAAVQTPSSKSLPTIPPQEMNSKHSEYLFSKPSSKTLLSNCATGPSCHHPNLRTVFSQIPKIVEESYTDSDYLELPNTLFQFPENDGEQSDTDSDNSEKFATLPGISDIDALESGTGSHSSTTQESPNDIDFATSFNKHFKNAIQDFILEMEEDMENILKECIAMHAGNFKRNLLKIQKNLEKDIVKWNSGKGGKIMKRLENYYVKINKAIVKFGCKIIEAKDR